MRILMRIIQEFDAANEEKFMAFEKKFAELEKRRPDYPNGRRLQPLSSSCPNNTLIWEYDFADLNSAYEMLDFFNNDAEHDELLAKQKPFFRNVRIEFYKVLEL